jgi:hypothetical protein
MTRGGLLLQLNFAGVANPRRLTRWMPRSLRNTLPVAHPLSLQHGLTVSSAPVPRPPAAKPPKQPDALQVANAILLFTPAAPLVLLEKPLEVIGSTIADTVLGSAEFSPSLFGGILRRS